LASGYAVSATLTEERDVSDEKRKAEQHMAEWLAHPMEFGVRPRSVRHKRTYKGKLLTYGNVEIHLVEYVMPDGTRGRGFVNGSLTWSFLGDEINAIDDDDLIVAYCGWAWLFPAIQGGTVLTSFASESEEALFTAKLRREGFGDVVIQKRYKIGTSELFEFTGTVSGKRVRGAGGTENKIFFAEGDSCFNLPSIYFLLGRQVIESLSG
jgi:hypothetical protein